MHSLPTTPGSIVTFDLPADSDGEVYRAVATLIPGHIDLDGTVHNAVWAGAMLESPDDTGNVFDEAVILESNPAVHTVTEAGGDPESVFEEGTVIRVPEDEVTMTYTYAPSFIYDGELRDLMWTNAYGGYLSADTLERVEHEVLYIPTRRA